MIFIRGPTDVRRIRDPEIRRLVEQRFAEILDGAPYDPEIHGEFIFVEPGDTAAALEAQSGWPLLSNPFDGTRLGEAEFSPLFEWLAEHPRCFELAVIGSDEGTGLLILIPKAPGVDSDLLDLCAQFAEPVPAVTS